MNLSKLFERRSTQRAAQGVSPSGDYTQDAVALAVLNASGQALRGVPAAIEICASTWQLGMATAEIEPVNARTRALTPSVLGYIGRYVLKYGEALFEIGIGQGGISLRPAQHWRVEGGVDPSTWEYELTFQGPNRYEIRTLSPGRVLHVMYAQNHSAPYRGVGPLNEAGLTQELVVQRFCIDG